jgi:branched-subunit amino acid transport protein
MNPWVVVLLAGLVSYTLRMSMILTDRLRLPSRLEESVELVAPAAFAALAMSSLATAAVAAVSVPAATAWAAAPLVLGFATAVAATVATRRPYAALVGLPTYWLAAAVL